MSSTCQEVVVKMETCEAAASPGVGNRRSWGFHGDMTNFVIEGGWGCIWSFLELESWGLGVFFLFGVLAAS
jgi:hypothetical protein